MKAPAARLGPSALLALGALTVHELRYRLAFGGHADEAISSQGHAYLGVVSVAAAVLTALALGLFLRRLSRVLEGRDECLSAQRGPLITWVAAALALIAVYSGQEALEGLLTFGHPAGLEGLFGHGGWIAVPTAIAVGAVIALSLSGARTAIHRAVAARRGRVPLRAWPGRRLGPPEPRLPRTAPLASSAAGRAPPID